MLPETKGACVRPSKASGVRKRQLNTRERPPLMRVGTAIRGLILKNYVATPQPLNFKIVDRYALCLLVLLSIFLDKI